MSLPEAFAGVTAYRVGPRKWWADLEFKCPRCGHRHDIEVAGEGDLSTTFIVKCPVENKWMKVHQWHANPRCPCSDCKAEVEKGTWTPDVVNFPPHDGAITRGDDETRTA